MHTIKEVARMIAQPSTQCIDGGSAGSCGGSCGETVTTRISWAWWGPREKTRLTDVHCGECDRTHKFIASHGGQRLQKHRVRRGRWVIQRVK
jgi:hypothetical protein